MKKTFLSVILICIGFIVICQERKFDIVNRSFIFPLQELHVHGSSIVELPNGDFIAAWFEGTGERTADDVKIMGAKYNAKSKTWGKAYVMADTEGLPDCNPVLFLNKGKLFLFWIAVQANRWEQSLLKFKTSTDFQKNEVVWSWQDNILLKPNEDFVQDVKKKFKELPASKQGWAEFAPKYDNMIIEASEDLVKRSWGWMTRIKPLVLSSGRILLPIYSDGLNFSMMAISDDDGKTWTNSLPLVGRGNIQPALIQKANGDIVAYMRDTGDEPSLLQESTSKDQGMTWTANKEINLPSTASVEVVKVNNSNWLLVINDVVQGRSRLSLYQSKDEGISWHNLGPIVEDKSGEGRFSYPAFILASDGMVHLTYSHHKKGNNKTIEHVIINPKSIKQ